MPLGLALIVIFILYLIDKHNRWHQAAKIGGGLVILGLLVVGSIFGWQQYQSWQLAKHQAQERVKIRAACLESAKNATTKNFIPDVSICDSNAEFRWQPACENGLVVGCVDASPQPWKKYGATQIYELEGKRYEVPKDTTLDELDEAVKYVSQDSAYLKAPIDQQKGYLAFVIETNKKKREGK